MASKTTTFYELKKVLLVKQDWKCFYCGREIYTVESYNERRAILFAKGMTRKIHKTQHLATADHVIAKSKGGSDLPHNIVLACPPCNLAKGNLSVEEFKNIIRPIIYPEFKTKINPEMFDL